MKAIMYHYVKEDDPSFPNFNHLHIEDFKKQLDYLENQFGFVTKKDFQNALESGDPPKGVILTFDDGLKCHYDQVFPVLKEKGLWGIFYVATEMYRTQKLLDVHRIHLLLGQGNNQKIYEYLNEKMPQDYLVDSVREDFEKLTYLSQINDNFTEMVKKILNYYISYTHREKVIDDLCKVFLKKEDMDVLDFYLTAEEMVEMENAGMIIGSHTVSHPVMSKLDLEAQKIEIQSSFKDLSSFGLRLSWKSFCYPYGGFHTFTEETEALLEMEKCRFSFNVESRDISKKDLTQRKQALPRYDCNEFPFGQVRRIGKVHSSSFSK
jgi:peptidoglycan/xylan/chitin deacetylase (PgdA/CDA1 family)